MNSPNLSNLTEQEKSDFLALSSAARSQPHFELVRQLNIAEKLFPWAKWLGGLMGLAILALVHVEVRLARTDENAQAIKEVKTGIDATLLLTNEYKLRLEILEKAKSSYDVTVVPKVATWDRTAEDWKTFDDGTQNSDRAHLRELWWATQPKR